MSAIHTLRFTLHGTLSTLLICWLLTSSTIAQWPADTSTNLAVCVRENNQQFPVLAMHPDGGCFVIWQDSRDGSRDLYGQRFDAEGNILWEPDGIAICAEAGAQGWPEAIPDGQGGVIIAWGEGRNNNQDVQAQRVDATGKRLWDPQGLPVCVEVTLQEDINLVTDGQGGAIVGWEDWRNGNQDIYIQRVTADGQLLWGENGVPACQSEGDQYDPVMVSDGQGGVFAVWWDISTPDWDIYAQHLNAEGEPQWGEQGKSVCSATGNQGGPVIVPDSAGGMIVAWVDYRDDLLGDLYVQRLNAHGQQQWAPDGVPICTLPSAQQQPTAISDGEGGIVLTWWDERDLFSDIYAQRINHQGEMLWQADGVPICVAEGVQREPEIVSTADGACILWKDYREDYAMDVVDHIYAQRIDANGNALWAADGVPVTTASGEQGSPSGIWIPSGFIVSWMDRRNGEDHDIYLQWIASD